MNVGLYQAASALNASQRWQEIITENLAASVAPGYKKQDLSFEAVQAGLLPAPAQGIQRFSMPRATSSVDFSQGQIRFTGVKTDVALQGRGFFAVQLPDGRTAYTRDGEFHISSSGQLVTKQGYPVLGDGGPIELDLNNPAEMSISATGEVSQGRDSKGRLQLIDFNDLTLLTPISSTCFLANDPKLQTVDASDTVCQQFAVETSNCSPISGLTQLITAMRQYEANQRVLQMQDERMGRAISELGNPA